MAKELPDSMDGLVYFTRRKFTPDRGRAVAWVERQPCEECGKGLMEKPRNEKTGKFKTRAKKYVCPECGTEEKKSSHEERLTCEIVYTCPFCSHEGETDVPFERRTWYGKKAVVFECGECGERLGITKKIKTPDKFLEKLP